MAKKKTGKTSTKKSTAVKGKDNKAKGKPVVPNPEKTTTLGDIIKDSEQAVVVTVAKGKIEVTGLKNINYAYEAKGLLIGAMDTYNSRPIINILNNNTRALLSHLVNINNKIPEPKKSELNIKKV